MKKKPTKITIKKQSNNNSLFDWPTEDELLVANILLDLPNIIAESESSRKFTWASKRRRTSLQPTAHNSHAPSPSVQQVDIKHHRENGGATNTPFSTVTDWKSNRSSKKRSSKTKREEMLVKIQELTRSGDVYRREIESVRKYRNKLLNENARLKSKLNEVLQMQSTTEQFRPG